MLHGKSNSVLIDHNYDLGCVLSVFVHTMLIYILLFTFSNLFISLSSTGQKLMILFMSYTIWLMEKLLVFNIPYG